MEKEDWRYQKRDFIPFRISRYSKRNGEALERNDERESVRNLGIVAYNLFLIAVPTAIVGCVFSKPIGKAFYEIRKTLENIF